MTHSLTHTHTHSHTLAHQGDERTDTCPMGYTHTHHTLTLTFITHSSLTPAPQGGGRTGTLTLITHTHTLITHSSNTHHTHHTFIKHLSHTHYTHSSLTHTHTGTSPAEHSHSSHTPTIRYNDTVQSLLHTLIHSSSLEIHILSYGRTHSKPKKQHINILNKTG